MEKGLTKNQVVNLLSKSTHGKLEEYVPIATQAAKEDPEFLARLIAWNQIKGQVRDSKVALPIISLGVEGYHDELVENSLAHLALLSPREMEKAYRFALQVRPKGKMRTLLRFTREYLKYKEINGFNRAALLHGKRLKSLYALTHLKPGQYAKDILFEEKYPKGSVFQAVRDLPNMSPSEAAGTILTMKIPFLVAVGALKEKVKDTNLVMALIKQMTPTELVTNSKMLERLGVKNKPELRAAYEEALEKAAKSKKATLKTTKAAEAVGDEKLSKKLKALQEKQLNVLGGIEGNWLVLADRSSSMTNAIEVGRTIAALLARMVKGTVSLVFFNESPRFMDVTGKTLEEITEMSRHERASGTTSIGCGLKCAMDRGVEIDGIAIVTDCGENEHPYFSAVYGQFVKDRGKTVPVYIYQFRDPYDSYSWSTQFQAKLAKDGVEVSTYDVDSSLDYYSLPNLVQTMRTNRYSLVDEVYATELLKLSDVFKKEVA